MRKRPTSHVEQLGIGGYEVNRVTQAEKIMLGDSHEALAAKTLERVGCRVTNLNLVRRNYPHDDLEVVTPAGRLLRVQVKKSRQTNGLLLGGNVYRTPSILEQFPHLNRDGFIVSYNHLGHAYVIPYRTLLQIITGYFAHYYAWQDSNGRTSRKNTCMLIYSTAAKAGIDFAPYREAWDQILKA